MNETCGCCEGIEQLTPLAIANRPGLDALFYRIGTHASFLETMLARLSNLWLCLSDLNNTQDKCPDQDKSYPLQGLTTRAESDPAIALLDAWATVAHVLTFYQERIANEGYLRTATERRSILELARLVGYVLRPGVAASVFLAYTLEKDHNVTILPGNRAQSVPDPGELPQSFETAEKLEARFDWNTLKPRLTQPQFITYVSATQIRTHTKDGAIYFKGTTTHLKEGDPLLFIFDVGQTPQQFAFPIISKVEAQAAENRTKVMLIPLPQTLSSTGATNGAHGQANNLQVLARGNLAATNGGFFLRDIVDRLKEPPSLQPPNTQRLERSVVQAFSAQSDIHPQLLVNLTPALQGILYSAISNAPGPVSSQPVDSIQAFRVKAAPFGHNAPLKPILNNNGATVGYEEWPLGSLKIDLQLSFSTGIGPQAAGAGTPPDVTFGGKPINNVDITITQGSKVFPKKEVDLKPVITGGSISPVTLDNGMTFSVTVVAGTTTGTTTTPNDMKLTFTGSGIEQEVIHLTDSPVFEGPLQVSIQIDSDQPQTLRQYEKQGYSTNQRRVDTEFGGQTISISDELFTSILNPLSILDPKILPLDAQYDKIIPESWVVVERPDKNVITKVQHVHTVSIAAYGITGRVTQLTLYEPWLEPTDQLLSDIRSITIYAQSTSLHSQSEQAEEPIEDDIEDVKAELAQQKLKVGTDTIELDRLYDGLHSGQRLIVSGERTDVISNGVTVTGVKDSELVMLKNVRQDVQLVRDPTDSSKEIPLPGDKKHTFLQFANALQFTYKRDTLTIYANVVRATHGETHSETLGSGDGSRALQQFALRQSPLTSVPASTPAGGESTREVRVNDILWHEVDSLPGLKPTDRSFITETDDAGKTTVLFGNGKYGARLPTGVENVKAVYRTGIGKPGNVKAEQITLLSTKPLGVKSVVNPIKASGGADRENRDQARRNVPLAAIALDRLVSVQDYADFARTFAGIGKASAVPLSDRQRQLVHLSIAGADNIPIETASHLYRNLFQALRQFGDPNQPLTVEIAEVKFIVISAKVHLLPDYLLESVEPKIRAKLLDTFSFDRRELGQSVFQSEVLSVIQSIAGVDYVDLEILGALDETIVVNTLDDFTKNPPPDPPKEEEGEPQETDEAGETAPEELAEEFLEALGLTGHDDIAVKLAQFDTTAPHGIAPAQLAFLSPDVPDTLIITELPR